MRRITLTLWVVLVIALLHLGWTLLHRRAQVSAAAHQHASAVPVDRMPGIVSFYATAGEIREGDPEIICYGVQNASAVRIEPPIEQLTPALTRCFWAEPHRDSRYKLVAEGIDGRQVSESFEVRVKPALLLILLRRQPQRDRPRRCRDALLRRRAYRFGGVSRPSAGAWRPSRRTAPASIPKITHNYALVARGVEGSTDQEKFTVKVK